MRSPMKVSLALLAALFVSALTAETAQAQPLKVNVYPSVSKVNSTTCKVRIRVKASVAGVGNATFQSNWFYVKKFQAPKFPPVKTILFFRFTTRSYWSGNRIYCVATVRATFFGRTLTITRTSSASVS